MIKSLSRTGTWKTYSISDGLPSLRIVYIAEDCEGYIWFAAHDNGVCRFDGDAFQHFTTQEGLIHDHVSCIQKDRQGRLWFGTLNGVCWYDGVGFHYLADDGIAGCEVRSIYEDRQGRIWFGGISTVGYYDGTAFHDLTPLYLEQYQQPLPPDFPLNNCVGIAQDPQGHLWFGFKDLIRFDGESFHRYEADEGFPRIRAGYSVGQDHTGKVWIGRKGRGLLYFYDNNTFQSVKEGLNCWLRRITCDRDGRMWFGTMAGAFYQDDDGFSRFTAADGLPHSSVTAVFHDREDHFWFATWNGVGRYDAHSITVFDPRANIIRKVNEVSQIAQDRQGDVWIGYASLGFDHPGKSIVRFDGAHFTFVESEQGRDISNCFSIYEDLEGHLWFGGGEGLFRRAGQTLKKEDIATDIDAGGIGRITQDRQGRFLFGYWEHYTIRQGKRKFSASPLQIVYQQGESCQTIFAEEGEKIPLSRIGAVIATRNDEIYFHLIYIDYLASGSGFARWHLEEGLTWYGIADGLIDDRVNDLVLDRDGNLWVATQGGLSCFDGHTFHSFTTEDGLPSNRIHCLLEDARGRLWIGTDREVAQYDGQIFQIIKSPHIGSVCRIFEDRDGTFWLGTVAGSVIRYRPRQISPRIRLTQVTTDQVYEKADGCSSTVGQPVVFEYKGIGFATPPRDMLYVYRLQGYDADWCPATRELRASYQDLPPGDYTFQVRAIDRDLNYSETAQVQLAVEPDPAVEGRSTAFDGGNQWIGQAQGLREFQTKLTEVAPTDLTVLILGEKGVGKRFAAQTLHALSAYGNGPFIQVNCGALSQALIDRELFGLENKKATSAVGKVELAQDGTLFLDEIGDLTLDTQDKILRLLKERTFERVGGNKTRTAQTRMVVATSRDLQKMVQAGVFREELYSRLQFFTLYMPPLREYKEDIPALAEFFKNRMAAYLDKEPPSLSSEAIELLQAYDWPGNAEELEHCIQQVVIACQSSQIGPTELMQVGFDLADDTLGSKRGALSVAQGRKIMPLLELERRYILEVLNATNWRVKGPKGAAALLGMPASTLYSKMIKLGIKRS